MRLGIFGGTFDPIHYGHLKIAELAYSRLRLDKLLFVPNSMPPHKPNVYSTPQQRFEMAGRAIKNNTHFELEDFELRSKKFSYTYRTLCYLNEKYKNPEMYFIAGADNVKQIERWKRPDIIFKMARVAFIKRPGFEFDTSFKYTGNSIFLEFKGVDISSTEIRNRVCRGKSISEMVPPEVNKYIMDNYLYKYDYIKEKLKNYINPKRYEHSLNVASEAVKLANHYGVDPEKAYLSGLVHDCAKDIDISDQLEMIENGCRFSIMKDELAYPKVVHALTGTIVAERDFGIKDNEILQAIRFHTLGNVKMTPLDKIIYVADLIEEKRNYNGIEILRKMAYNNINQTIIQSINNTISYLGEKKVQKDIIDLREFLKERQNELI